MFTIARFENNSATFRATAKSYESLAGLHQRSAQPKPSRALRTTFGVSSPRLIRSGHMTRYDYSPLNQIIKVTNPLANFTSFS